MRYPTRFTRYGLGDKRHRAPNPPQGAIITYYLKEKIDPPKPPADQNNPVAPAPVAGESDGSASSSAPVAGESKRAASSSAPDSAAESADGRKKQDPLRIEILAPEGEVIRTLDAKKLPKEAGLNRTAWDLSLDPAKPRRPPEPGFIEFFGGPRGPAVLPGTYTVRITHRGESQEVPVDVRVDPTVPMEPGALEAQQEAAMKLRDMATAMNLGLKGLDQLAAQLAERRKTAEAMELELGEVEKAWKDYDKTTEELMGSLSRVEGKPFWSQGPRVSERIEDLMRDIDGQFSAPTAAQVELMDEVWTEFEEALAKINEHLANAVPALNEALAGAGVPAVAVPEPAEFRPEPGARP